ncbi:MAG: PQQ-like beta-propeller repeat protein [Verrucomicrobia bacterium]|nr:PQQ-like beta-propeller repeat protein [Verrucomicrobiota bacterium]
MKSRQIIRASAFCFLMASLITPSKAESNWPQWRGTNRDGHSTDTGLLNSWPETGPEMVWIFKNAGKGYSSPAIADGRYYSMGTRDNNTILLCLDANTGEEQWAKEIGNILGNGWGDGPRGTPAVDGDKVYALTGEGNLVCASTKDGTIVWETTMSKLGGSEPKWGYSESVLLDGSNILVTPGGDKGTVAALDKASGKVIWQSGDITDHAHYSSVVAAEINGSKQYVQRTEKSIFGLNPETGNVLWKTDFPGRTAVIPTPIVLGNRVYVTAGYGAGCKAIEIQPDNTVKELYSNREMKNHHGGVVRVGGQVFGYSDGIGWLCQNLSDGSEVWAERKALGKGAITYVDGKLICLDESKGHVVMLDASTKGYNELSRFTLDPQSEIRASRGKIWTHPVIVNGKLYLRDQDLIYCYKVK